VEPSAVKQELTELVRYHEETKLLLRSQAGSGSGSGNGKRSEAAFDNPAFDGEHGAGTKSNPVMVTGKSTKAMTSPAECAN
jgi:hypothetical protein